MAPAVAPKNTATQAATTEEKTNLTAREKLINAHAANEKKDPKNAPKPSDTFAIQTANQHNIDVTLNGLNQSIATNEKTVEDTKNAKATILSPGTTTEQKLKAINDSKTNKEAQKQLEAATENRNQFMQRVGLTEAYSGARLTPSAFRTKYGEGADAGYSVYLAALPTEQVENIYNSFGGHGGNLDKGTTTANEDKKLVGKILSQRKDKDFYDGIVENGDEEAFKKLQLADKNLKAYREKEANGELTDFDKTAYAQVKSEYDTLVKELSKYGDMDKALRVYGQVSTDEWKQSLLGKAVDFIDRHPVIGGVTMTAASVLSSPVRGLIALEGTLEDLGGNETFGVNDILNEFSEAVTSEVSNNIYKSAGGGVKGTIAKWCYSAAVSSMESALTMAAGAALMGVPVSGIGALESGAERIIAQLGTDAIFFANASTETYREALERGLDLPHALLTAGFAGAAEVFFEKFSLDRAYDVLQAGGHISPSALADLLISGGIEGSEELFTSGANTLTDWLINGEGSEIVQKYAALRSSGMSDDEAKKAVAVEYAKQYGEDFIVGMMSGMFGKGGLTTVMDAANIPGDIRTGAAVKQAIGTGKLTTGDIYATTEGLGNGYAKSAIGKLKNGGSNITSSNYKTGKALRTAVLSNMGNETARRVGDIVTDTQIVNAEKRRIARLGEKYKPSARFTERLRTTVLKNASKEDMKILTRKNETAEQRKEALAVRDKVYSDEGINASLQTMDAVRLGNGGTLASAVREAAGAKINNITDEKVTKYEGHIAKAQEEYKAIKESGDISRVPESSTGYATDAGRAYGITDGGEVIIDKSGASAPMSSVNFTDEESANLFREAAKMVSDGKITSNAMNAFLSVLAQNTDLDIDLDERLRYMAQAYEYGKKGADFDLYLETITGREASDAYMYLGDSEIRFALDLGRDNFKAEPGVTRIGVRRTLSKKQENQLIAIDAFAKKYGLTIIVTPKLYANGQTLREYANGVENGKVIVLSLAAEDNALTVAAFHEALHMLSYDVKTPLINDMIRQLIADEGENFRNIFYQRYALYHTTTAEDKASLKATLKELDFNGDVMAQLAELFGEKELADTYEEIAAQYAGTLLSRDDVLAELAEKNPTGLKKFVAEIKKFLTEVRNYIAYLAKHDETAAAALRKDAKEAADLAERITDALEKAEFGERNSENGKVKYALQPDIEIEDKNIANGLNALETMMEQAKTETNPESLVVENAMYRSGIGSIDLKWGIPGKGAKFKKGFGFAHIIAKHGEGAARKAIEVIAKGTESDRQGNDGTNESLYRTRIYYDGYTVVLNKNPGTNNWLLTAWEDNKETAAYATGEVRDSSGATAATSTLNRRNGVNTAVSYHIISNSPIKSNTENEENSPSHKSLQTTDAEYMGAVERGDMETAQRMVEEAAKAAGYDHRVYHGTTYYGDINTFKKGKTGYLGPGIYLATSEHKAQHYADAMGYGNGSLYKLFAKTGNTLNVYGSNATKEILRAIYGSDRIYESRSAKQSLDTHIITAADIKKLLAKGYDSVTWNFGSETEIAVYSPNAVKSADPVTYDDDGKVIPLSERFNKENTDIRYSKQTDSEGNVLSEQQAEYFANSKVRDDDGKLLTMYHGTPNAGFSIFRRGTYFTQNKDYADLYQGQGASSLGYKKTADNPDTYAVYLNITKPFDTRNKKERDIFRREYLGKWGMGTDLMESGLPDWMDGMDLQEFIEENGYDYDGLILDEGGVGGYGEEVKSRGLSYVVFNANQVKDIANKTPTENEDYRYSRQTSRMGAEDVAAMTEGNEELETQVGVLNDIATTAARGIAKQMLGAGWSRDKVMPKDEKLNDIVKGALVDKEDKKAIKALRDWTKDFLWRMYNGAPMDMETAMSELTQLVKMQAVSAGYYEQIDDSGKELRQRLKGTKIYLQNESLGDIRSSYGSVQKANREVYPWIILTTQEGAANEGATSLDVLYDDLLTEGGYALTEEARQGGAVEMLRELSSILRSSGEMFVSAAKQEGLSGETLDEWSQQAAVETLAKIYEVGYSTFDKNSKIAEKIKTIEEIRAKMEADIREQTAQAMKAADERVQRVIDKAAADAQTQKTTFDLELQAEKERSKAALEELAKNARERYDERTRRARERREETDSNRKARTHIIRTADKIRKLLLNETDEKHVPEDLKNNVLDFLELMTFDGHLWGDAELIISRLASSYEDIRKAEESQDGYYNPLMGEYDADIAFYVSQLKRFFENKSREWQKTNKDKPKKEWNPELSETRLPPKKDETKKRKEKTHFYFSDLSTTEIAYVRNITDHVYKLIKEANETVLNGKKARITDLGQTMMAEAAAHKAAKIRGDKVEKAKIFLQWKDTKPVYGFKEKLGGVAGRFFDDFRDAQDLWFVRINEGHEKIEQIKEETNYESWKNEKTEFVFHDGWNVVFDKEAVMQIYATQKRELASGTTTHIQNGGIVLSEDLNRLQIELSYKKLSDKKLSDEKLKEKIDGVTKDSNGHPLSLDDIMQIANSLTDEQKKYVDSVVAFLSTTAGGWGNEASMELVGIPKYTEKYYFPFQSSKNYLYTRFGVTDDTRLKHTSFTNRTQQNASTPLAVSSFTDVAAGHIQQMALYSAFVNPIENFTRVYSYKDRNAVTSVKTALENAYGKGVNEYIDEFMKAMNGGMRSDNLDDMLSKGTKWFKRAAVMANLSVVVQQPSAVCRAFAVIDPKYFRNTVSAADYREMLKYNPIAGIKKMGGFDTGTAQSAVEWIAGGKNYKNKIPEKVDRVSEFMGVGAEFADNMTWTGIWNACKRETRELHPDVAVGSEEFFKIASGRFRDVIEYTQVYDSTLTKSELMRGKGAFTKMFTAFMAEPTTSYNLLFARGQGKTIHTGRAVTAFVLATMLNDALKSLVVAMRDDDDDYTYLEKYIASFVGSLIGSKDVFFLNSDLNPLNLIPGAKDIISILQGFDIERADMTVIADFFTAAKKLLDEFGKNETTGEWEMPTFDKWKELFIAASAFTPIPIKSVVRDGEGLYNSIRAAVKRTMHFDKNTLRAAIKAEIGFDSGKPEKAYYAVLNGDKETEARMTAVTTADIRKYIADGYTEEEAEQNAIVSKYRQFHKYVVEGMAQYNDDVVKAAEAKFKGQTGSYEGSVNKLKAHGFTQNDIVTAVDKIIETKLRIPELEAEEMPDDKGLYKMQDAYDQFDNRNLTGFKNVKAAMIEAGIKDEKSINSNMKKRIKGTYEEGTMNTAQTVQALIDYAGMTEAAAKSQASAWEFELAYPDSTLDEKDVKKFYEKLAPQGITLKTYEAYYNATKDAEGATKKAQVMAAIDALPISNEQKDTFYYFAGYASSRIYEAPWH